MLSFMEFEKPPFIGMHNFIVCRVKRRRGKRQKLLYIFGKQVSDRDLEPLVHIFLDKFFAINKYIVITAFK